MPLRPAQIKAVFFDFMGTCLDWHTSVVQSLPSSIHSHDASLLALEWRRQFFIEIDRRFQQNLQPEDIDETLARTFNVVLDMFPSHSSQFETAVKKRMIEAWHTQPAWPDVTEAIRSLREDLGLEVFVLANGTTRLQLDLTRSSGLHFDMLFSSQLLDVYKPSPDAYIKALQLVKLGQDEVVMVAAHAYDLRAAKKIGMNTIYIHRWTDDVDENMDRVKTECDVFLDDMKSLSSVIASI